nr:hypothetical protein [Tanacetum cinerariifolium]
MANLSKDIQCASSDTRPPMLDRTDFTSWQQRIRLYCRGKENGVNILKSINDGPYQMGTVREPLAKGTKGAPHLGPERPRVYSDLSPKEKDRYNADIWAINILLQGLPKDIYTLINHYTDAKDILDNVKMLLEGSELTKEDPESQLYDDFEDFQQHKGETIHDYYVRFMTAVKLKRGLRDSNYDQLYAYLKQHETHAMENKMMLEQLSQKTMDPLALMSNVSNQQRYSPSSSTSSSTHVPQHLADNAHLDSSLSAKENLIENLTNMLALLTKSYKTFLPQTNNQGMNPRSGGAAGYGGVQNRVGNANPGQARQVKCYNCNGRGHIVRNYTQPKCPQNPEYYKDKMLLMQAQENGVALDAVQLLFLAGGQDNAIDDDVDEQPVQDLALNVDNVFQAEDSDAFDSDVDEALTVQTMFMANLSSADPVTDEAGPSYDSNILSEVQDHDHYQDAVCAYHEEHAMHDSVQLNHIVDSHANYTSDSNMILYDQYVKDNEVPVVYSNVSFVPNDAYMMIYNDMYESHAQLVSNTSRNTIVENSLTAELATYKEKVELHERRAKAKPYYNELNKVAIGYKNPLCLTRAKQVQPALYNGHEFIKDNHVPAIVHNTENTLEIAEITRKKINDKIKDPKYVTRKVKIAPHDYSKENFLAIFTPQKQLTLEQIFWSQDIIKLKSKALKEQTTISRPIKALTVYLPNTPAMLVSRVLPMKSQVKIHIFTLIQLFLEFDKTCKKRITPTWLTEGERGFEQTKECYLKEVIPFFKTLKDNFKGVQKKHDAIERKNLLIINDNLITECLSKEVFSVAINFDLNVARFTEMHATNTIVEARCLELEAELASLRDKSHHDNQEELNNHFSKLEELLEYAIGTCPQDTQQQDKQLVHIPLIRKKQFTFAKPSDKSNSNTHKHVAKVITQKTNVPMPPSTGVNRFPNTSGSQPRSNTKKNRISLAKGVNKLPVEDQPRTNKSHLRTSNHVDSSSHLKRGVINSNSDSVCQTCNKCLISSNHDMCVVNYLQYVVAPLYSS